MPMQKKPFKNCTLAFLEDELGIQQMEECRTLDAWLAPPHSLDSHDITRINELQKLLRFNVMDWNEQELALHFIGPLLTYLNFSSKAYNLFAGREISGVVEKTDGTPLKLLGKPDGMIASGRREPKQPYFCFQEYKKERDNSGDPAAQALAAMLVGQQLNQTTNTIYGAYIIGRDWYFMTLIGKEYCISRGYDATTDDLHIVFSTLLRLKQKIMALLG